MMQGSFRYRARRAATFSALALLVTATLPVQAAWVQLGAPEVQADFVALPVLLQSAGDRVASLQFQVVFDPASLELVEAAAGPAASQAGKDVALGSRPGRATIIAAGLNQRAMPDGVVCTLLMRVLPDAADRRVALANVVVSDPAGASVQNRKPEPTTPKPPAGPVSAPANSTGDSPAAPASPAETPPPADARARAGALTPAELAALNARAAAPPAPASPGGGAAPRTTTPNASEPAQNAAPHPLTQQLLSAAGIVPPAVESRSSAGNAQLPPEARARLTQLARADTEQMESAPSAAAAPGNGSEPALTTPSAAPANGNALKEAAAPRLASQPPEVPLELFGAELLKQPPRRNWGLPVVLLVVGAAAAALMVPAYRRSRQRGPRG